MFSKHQHQLLQFWVTQTPDSSLRMQGICSLPGTFSSLRNRIIQLFAIDALAFIIQCVVHSFFCGSRFVSLANVSHVYPRPIGNGIWIWICWLLQLLSAQSDTLDIFHSKSELEFTISMLCILMANFTCYVLNTDERGEVRCTSVQSWCWFVQVIEWYSTYICRNLPYIIVCVARSINYKCFSDYTI